MVQVKAVTVTIEVVAPRVTYPEDIAKTLRGSEKERLDLLNKLARQRGDEAKEEGEHRAKKESLDRLILTLLVDPVNSALIESNPALRRELLNPEKPDEGYSITIGGRRVTHSKETVLLPEEKKKGNLEFAMQAIVAAIEKAKAGGEKPAVDPAALKKPDRTAVTDALLRPEFRPVLAELAKDHRVVTVLKISFAKTPKDTPEAGGQKEEAVPEAEAGAGTAAKAEAENGVQQVSAAETGTATDQK